MRALKIGVSLQLFAQFQGINTVIYFAPTTLKMVRCLILQQQLLLLPPTSLQLPPATSTAAAAVSALLLILLRVSGRLQRLGRHPRQRRHLVRFFIATPGSCCGFSGCGLLRAAGFIAAAHPLPLLILRPAAQLRQRGAHLVLSLRDGLQGAHFALHIAAIPGSRVLCAHGTVLHIALNYV